jgi:phage FluMu protein Com
MRDRLSFRCSHCNVKLYASVRLVGRSGSCPKCKRQVIVRFSIPSDADVILAPATAERAVRR